MRLRILLLVTIALALVSPRRAAAQGDPWKAAQAAFSQGETFYLSGKFDDAAASFKKAYEARPMPQFLYNVGAAYHMKGKKASEPESYDKAVDYYTRYLTENKEAKDRDHVEKVIEVLKAEAERLRAAVAAIAAGGGSDGGVTGAGNPDGGTGAAPVAIGPSAEVESLGDVTYRGLVVIESEPQGANVYINGKEKGPFAQTPWSGSMDGEFQYLVEKRGYKSKEGRTAADPTRLLLLQVVLSEEDYLGWLEIKSNVPGANIFLDDRAVGAIGKTPFSGNFKPGKHKVWIEADGYETSEHDIEIIAGEAAEIAAQLKGAPVGYLYVRGPGIESSRIYLDGQLLCERGPCRKPVKEGRHKVSVRRSGYKSYSATIEVQAKTEINLKTELAKKPGRGDAIVAYVFSGLFAGGGIYLGLESQKLEQELKDAIAAGTPPVDQSDPRFTRGKYFAIGANAAYGVAGLLGLAAIYYTFREKGRPSVGVVDVRALALTPSIGPNYAGLSMELPW
ncbi:MAG: PEGA domain-containing protein [Myxococcales bacterium]|nr:PEGA domain-containing protein [Myxococcales bacterium]